MRRELTEYTRRKSTWLLAKTISHVLLRRVYTGRHSTCELLQTTLHVTLRRGLYMLLNIGFKTGGYHNKYKI